MIFVDCTLEISTKLIQTNQSFFTKMSTSIGKVELPDRPAMNDTTAGKLAQTQFISSTIKVR